MVLAEGASKICSARGLSMCAMHKCQISVPSKYAGQLCEAHLSNTCAQHAIRGCGCSVLISWSERLCSARIEVLLVVVLRKYFVCVMLVCSALK